MFPKIVIILLLAATVLTGIRVIIGPSVWDRLLGLYLVSTKIIILIVLFAFISSQSFYLDVGLAFALLGFVGTTSLAKFLQKDDKEKENEKEEGR